MGSTYKFSVRNNRRNHHSRYRRGSRCLLAEKRVRRIHETDHMIGSQRSSEVVIPGALSFRRRRSTNTTVVIGSGFIARFDSPILRCLEMTIVDRLHIRLYDWFREIAVLGQKYRNSPTLPISFDWRRQLCEALPNRKDLAASITPFLMFEGKAEEAIAFRFPCFRMPQLSRSTAMVPARSGPRGVSKRRGFRSPDKRLSASIAW
jgi:hypothetical protein